MESRQEVNRHQEFIRIIDLIILKHSMGCAPDTMLRRLLKDYLLATLPCSTLFVENPDIKLVKAMLHVLKEQCADPIPALIWHLNSVSAKIQPQWPVVLILSAYFAVYQQYRVHLNEQCTALFASQDVWHDMQQHYFTLMVTDLQSASEGISLAAFQVLCTLRFTVPSAQRSIVVTIVNSKLVVNAGKPLKLAILQHAKSLHEWLDYDKVATKVFLSNILKNVYSEDKELRNAACAAVVALQHVFKKKILAAHLNKIIKRVKRSLTNGFLIKVFDALVLLFPIIPPKQGAEIVNLLALKIDCLAVATDNSVRLILGRFFAYLPLENRESIVNEGVIRLDDAEDERFLAVCHTFKFLDGFIPSNKRGKIVDVLCKNLREMTVSTARQLAALECLASMINSIPVNQYHEVIAHVSTMAADKNLLVNIRRQAIVTLEKLRFIFFIEDCKRIPQILLTIITDAAEVLKLREQALKTLVQLRDRIIFSNSTHFVTALLQPVSEECHPGMIKINRIHHLLNDKTEENSTFKIHLMQILSYCINVCDRDEYVKVKNYLLAELMKPDEDLSVKIQAARSLCQLARAEFGDAVTVEITPCIQLLDSLITDNNPRAMSFGCELLRQLKPLVLEPEWLELIDFLLLKRSNDHCPNRVFSLLLDYLPEMTVEQKLRALCLLKKSTETESSCHHDAKKLFIQIYQAYKRDLITDMLSRKVYANRVYSFKDGRAHESLPEYLPNHIGQHIIRFTN